jgi:hypothetical protein
MLGEPKGRSSKMMKTVEVKQVVRGDADAAVYAQVAPMLQNLFTAGFFGLETHVKPKSA